MQTHWYSHCFIKLKSGFSRFLVCALLSHTNCYIFQFHSSYLFHHHKACNYLEIWICKPVQLFHYLEPVGPGKTPFYAINSFSFQIFPSCKLTCYFCYDI
jgi:hypothetical protein